MASSTASSIATSAGHVGALGELPQGEPQDRPLDRAEPVDRPAVGRAVEPAVEDAEHAGGAVDGLARVLGDRLARVARVLRVQLVERALAHVELVQQHERRTPGLPARDHRGHAPEPSVVSRGAASSR